MRALKTLLLLSSLAIGGCFSGAPLDLPWPPEAQSVLILRQDSPEIVALERGQGQLSLSKDEEVVALFYELALRAYDLKSGRNEGTTEPTRPLPTPIERHQGRLAGIGFEWSESPADIDDLQDYRLPAIDLDACLEAGLCLSLDGERCLACTPQVPTPPAAVTTRCPWDTSLNLAECRPKVLVPETCPLGQRALWNEQACQPLSACPEAADGYSVRAASGPGVIYIRATGQPGDGSLTNPFGSLAAAHAAGLRQGTWVLGPGDFDAGLQFGPDTDLRIIGACAERTTLHSSATPLMARGGRLNLQQVQVSSSGPQAIVAEDAILIVSGSEIGPAADTLITATGGILQISSSSVRGPTLGIAQEGGILQIRDTTFELPEAVSLVSGSSMSIARTTISDPSPPGTTQGTAGIRIQGCQTCSISQVRIARLAGSAIRVSHAGSVIVSDVSAVNRPDKTEASGITFGAGTDPEFRVNQVELNDIYIAGMAGHGLHLDVAHLLGSNIFITSSELYGLVINQPGIEKMTLNLAHIYLADLRQTALWITGPGRGLAGPTVTIEDLSCHRNKMATRNAESCWVVRDNSTLTITRMAATGRHWNLGVLDSSDLTLSDLSAGPTMDSAFDLDPLGQATIRNSRLSSSPTQTVLTRKGRGQVTLDAVHIVGGETALLIEDNSRLAFSDLLIEDAATCIELQEAAEVSARGGHLKCTGTGIRYAHHRDLVSALPGVKIDARPALVQTTAQ